MSSPLMLPSTPRKAATTPYNPSWRPAHALPASSPLARPSSPASPTDSSPVPAAQRRRQQTQTHTPMQLHARAQPRRTSVKSVQHAMFSPSGGSEGPAPQKSLLRERFKARCFERARRAREKAVTRRRKYESEPSSDGFDLDADMDMDDGKEDEEEEEEDLDDELFRRIMNSVNRKAQHAYRVSYEWEVGSSIDPDMEDVSRWEQELHEESAEEAQPAPPDLEEEELAAYAEEAALFEDLEAFADDFFDDLEDSAPPPTSTSAAGPSSHSHSTDTDFDMDVAS
ncbi:hypothetical protein GLOTRDRAFT_139742 [Gloeophyllum trabeum ATCC 11539]|uniref:Uncharacterized protein n=1 Tax=Gloeophyllum trabeum (strain ATCC 11539 / FP-39264 / Madison 617) TaxID=670483 RepID=S7RH40_GLOTA|nr:uncharacterized protein GLOTRDRAFT_139742 [Gloeophyllum trabeum ATCC 11539]EPQ53545.1 hypothetical protein GLOTRDRAFT_139742 [Gloeophyllum trabeum ATCC 11539]